jgi:hypothetical protein
MSQLYRELHEQEERLADWRIGRDSRCSFNILILYSGSLAISARVRLDAKSASGLSRTFRDARPESVVRANGDVAPAGRHGRGIGERAGREAFDPEGLLRDFKSVTY